MNGLDKEVNVRFTIIVFGAKNYKLGVQKKTI